MTADCATSTVSTVFSAILEPILPPKPKIASSKSLRRLLPFLSLQMGTPVELNAAFARTDGTYRAAIRKLESELYRETA
jgi:hypothetical protein